MLWKSFLMQVEGSLRLTLNIKSLKQKGIADIGNLEATGSGFESLLRKHLNTNQAMKNKRLP